MRAECSYVFLLVVGHLLVAFSIQAIDISDFEDTDDVGSNEFKKYADNSSYSPCECAEETFPCYCVREYLCKDDGTIKTMGEDSLIVFRAGPKLKECPKEEICCILTENDIPDVSTKPSTTTTESDLFWPECGKRNHWPRANYGEDDTIPGEFPWMAALLRLRKTEYVFQCGASIVGPNLVLTAAHCVDRKKPDDFLVRAGVWNLSDDSESTQDRKVNIILKSLYNPDPPYNDVAVLVVDSPFRPGPRVSTVCLPTADMAFPAGTICIATGWSTGKYNDQFRARTNLRRAQLPIVSHAVCQKRLRRTYLGKFFRLHESFMCAGGNNIDTCTGDGGGPLICEKDDTYYQVGVVSWGVGCNLGRLPGVYANITTKFVRDWIETQLEASERSTGGEEDEDEEDEDEEDEDEEDEEEEFDDD